jgi:hypothetical protein
MNRVFYILVFVLSTIHCVQAQEDKIEVSYDKSVILVFDSPVKEKGWNCGDKENVGVGVQGNKVLLQAKEEHINETNLIVELLDGSIYAFDILYNNTPKKTFHIIKGAKAIYRPDDNGTSIEPSEPVAQKKDSKVETNGNKDQKLANSKKGNTKIEPSNTISEESTESEASEVKNTDDYITRIGVIQGKMMLYVGGIFSLGDNIYFKVNLKNMSSVAYDIDNTQFVIKSLKKGLTKSSSSQVEPIQPIYVLRPSQEKVIKDLPLTLVFVFKKFTIGENKKLLILFWEKNGDRNLELPVDGIDILNAKNTL